MNEWNKDFHGISILCTPKLVRIKNDKALIDFLNDPKTKGSLLVAEYAMNLYQQETGNKIAITKDSMAIEILGHVYLDAFAGIGKVIPVKGLKEFLQSIKDRTDIIDCGEASIDSNRKVWDDLSSTEAKRKIIYSMCGRMA